MYNSQNPPDYRKSGGSDPQASLVAISRKSTACGEPVAKPATMVGFCRMGGASQPVKSKIIFLGMDIMNFVQIDECKVPVILVRYKEV